MHCAVEVYMNLRMIFDLVNTLCVRHQCDKLLRTTGLASRLTDTSGVRTERNLSSENLATFLGATRFFATPFVATLAARALVLPVSGCS